MNTFLQKIRLSLIYVLLLTCSGLLAQTTFNYTGGLQTYTVPAGITLIDVDMAGGSGGRGFEGSQTNGFGLGGRLTCRIAVTPGEVLNLYVGNAGQNASSNTTPGAGGFNGGGNGASWSSSSAGGGGGGASDIRRGGLALANRILVAGGGGGNNVLGGSFGAGGGISGGSGSQHPFMTAVPATGGTQTTGGTGGTYPSFTSGANGTLGIGGSGGTGTNGGGGGGGYYGGGGGSFASGAGGSSYALPAATNVVHTQGFRTGAGYITISPVGPPAISSFSPASGNVGSTVTITGSNFTGATNVWFGAAPATSFTVVNATTITAVVPATAYSGTIAIKTPIGFIISQRDFRINNPQNAVISAGSRNYILKNGKLYAFGYAYVGDSSNNYLKNCTVEIPLKGSLTGKTIAQIAASSNSADGRHVLILASDGTVHSFGSNFNGALGDNSTTISLVPIEISTNGSLSGKNIVQVAAGDDNSYALAADGTVHSWGSPLNGALGNGTTSGSNVLLPINISSNGSLAGKTIIKITAQNSNVFCIAADGTVHGFGSNELGTLGIGTTTVTPNPTQLSTSGALMGRTIAAIQTSYKGSVFLTTDGYLFGTGNSTIATGTVNTNVPILIDTTSSSSSLKSKQILSIKTQNLGVLAIDNTNNLHSWGEGAYGALGNNGISDSNIPGLVNTSTSLNGKLVWQVGGGAYKGNAMTNDTSFHVWGRASGGLLGDGQNSVNALVPKSLTIQAKPTVEASTITFSSSSPTAARITFVSGNGTNRIVVVKPNNPVSPNAAIDGNSYTANTIFSSGGLIDGSGRVVFNGTGNSVLVTGLTNGTTYHVAVFEYFAATSPCNMNYYKLGSAATGSFTAGTLLPLTLLNFQATKTGHQTTLNWQTTNEINTSHFDVQHSTDGTNWSAVGVVNSYNTNGTHNYNFVHTSPVKGKNYYRLAQVDNDGRTTFSSIRSVDFEGKNNLVSVYPNPIKGYSFTVDLGVDITKPIAYTLFNSMGKQIQQGTINSRQQTIHTGMLPAGSYLLRLTSGQTVSIIK